MSEHHLDASTTHGFSDKAFPPRLEIESGDTVTFELREPLDSRISEIDHPNFVVSFYLPLAVLHGSGGVRSLAGA